MTSLRATYLNSCSLTGRVRPSPRVLELLPLQGGLDDAVVSLNLSGLVPARDLGTVLPVLIQAERLRRLVLRNNNLGDHSIQALVDALINHPALEELDVGGNPLTSGAGRQLLRLAQGNPRLVLIALDGTAVRNAVVAEIQQQLQLNRRPEPPGAAKLATAALPGAALGHAAARAVPAAALQVIPDLKTEHLDLRNSLGPRGLHALLPLLPAAARLRRLTLRDNNLGDRAVLELADVAAQHPALEELDLADNPITSRAGQRLLALAQANPRLVRLQLTGTAIRTAVLRDIEAQVRANAKQRNAARRLAAGPQPTDGSADPSCLPESPTELDFSHPEGVLDWDHVLEGVLAARHLQRLRLQGAGLEDSHVADLVDVLKRRSSLTDLDLRDNRVTSEGGRHLLKLLEANVSLTSVQVDGNPLRRIVARQVEVQADWNRHLKHAIATVPQAAALLHPDDPSRPPSPRSSGIATPTDTEPAPFLLGFPALEARLLAAFSFGEAEEDGGAAPGPEDVGPEYPTEDAVPWPSPVLKVKGGRRLLATGRRLGLRRPAFCVPLPDTSSARPPEPRTERPPPGVVDGLRGCVLFRHLGTAALQRLAEGLKAGQYAAGAVVYREGLLDPLPLCVLARGQCEATAAGREPQRLRPGAVFGAEEFLHGTPRAATVRAVAESTVLALDRGWYARVMRDVAGHRAADLADLLRSINLFAPLAAADVSRLADAMEERPFAPGERLCVAGQAADPLLFLRAGTAAVSLRGPEGGGPLKLCELVEGQHCGEVEFASGGTIRADVVAQTPVWAVGLPRRAAEAVVGPLPALGLLAPEEEDPACLCRRYRRRLAALRRHPQLRVVPKPEEDRALLLELFTADAALLAEGVARGVAADAMRKRHYRCGDAIVQEGRPLSDGDALFVLWAGEVSVHRQGAVLEPGCTVGTVFGESWLVAEAPPDLTVRVESETAAVYALDRRVYRALVGGARDPPHRRAELFLTQHPVLGRLPRPQIQRLARAVQLQEEKAGQVLLEAGDPVQAVHLITDGLAEVFHVEADGRETAVAALAKGDFVGGVEGAFGHASGCFRVRARTPLRLMALSVADFHSLPEPVLGALKDRLVQSWLYRACTQLRYEEGAHLDQYRLGDPEPAHSQVSEDLCDWNQTPHRLLRRRRGGVCLAAPEGLDSATGRGGMGAAEEQAVRRVLRRSVLFRHLDEAELGTVLAAMCERRFRPGEVVASEEAGDALLHVVVQGSCSLFEAGRFRRCVHALQFFGDEALALNYLRPVLARADTEVRTWALDGSKYHRTVRALFAQKLARHRETLRTVTLLSTLSDADLAQLADALQPHRCWAGEHLIRYGEEGTSFYLLLDGIAEVFGRGIKVCEFSKGQCIGEMEFINNHANVADVVAKTDVHTMRIDRAHFELCLGPLKDLVAECQEADPQFGAYNEQRKAQGRGKRKALRLVPKPEEDRATLLEMLDADTQLFLGNCQRHAQAADAMFKLYYRWGDDITLEGRTAPSDDDLFFVVWAGECSVFKDGERVHQCEAGALFGELEMMDDVPTGVTVTVESETAVIYALDRRTYKQIMSGAFDRRHCRHEVFLSHHPVLGRLPPKAKLRLAHAMQLGKVAGGEYVLRAGGELRQVHLIMHGLVEVSQVGADGSVTSVCELGKGDFLGAIECAFHHPTSFFTVRARTDVRALTLPTALFDPLLEPVLDDLKDLLMAGKAYAAFETHLLAASSEVHDMSQYVFGDGSPPEPPDSWAPLPGPEEAHAHSRRLRARRCALCLEVGLGTEGDIRDSLAMGEADERAVRQVLARSILFKHLDDMEMSRVLAAMCEHRFHSGEVIAQEQGNNEEALHVMMEGTCSVLQSGKYRRALRGLQLFGDEELMFNQPSQSTVRADTEVRTWALDQTQYHHTMSALFMQKMARHRRLLQAVTFLRHLSDADIAQLADALEPHNCRAGEYLIRYGEEGTWFYLVLEGTVDVYGRGAGNARIKVCEFSQGQCVGEMEFVNNHPTVADVVAQTDVRTVRLSRSHFELCMGPIKDLIADSREADPKFVYYTQKRKKQSQGRGEDKALRIIPKPEEDRATLIEMLEVDTQLFMGNARHHAQAADAMCKLYYKWNDCITQEHQPLSDGDLFFVVWCGECAVYVDNELLHRCEAGALFGEMEMMDDVPTELTIKVESETAVIYALDRRTYKQIMSGAFDRKNWRYEVFLGQHPLLKNLQRKEMMRLAHAMQLGKLAGGEYLLQRGKECRWTHVIMHGVVEVTVPDADGNPQLVCEIGKGGFVGAIECAFQHPTSVFNVRAKTELRSLMLSVVHFDACLESIMDDLKAHLQQGRMWQEYAREMRPQAVSEEVKALMAFQFGGDMDDAPDSGYSEPEGEAEAEVVEEESEAVPLEAVDVLQQRSRRLRLRRSAMCIGGEVGAALPRPPMSSELQQTLQDALAKSVLFKHLEDHEMQLVVADMYECRFKSGEVIAQEGVAADGAVPQHQDALHVMLEGNCSVFRAGKYKRSLRGLQVFGEEEMMFNQPVDCTVRADTEVHTWALSRSAYHAKMGAISAAKRTLYREFLQSISFLKSLSEAEITTLADALQPHRCAQGEYLIRYGEEGLWLYILLEGSVDVYGRSGTEPIKVCSFSTGQCVGDMEFMNNHRTVADVVAATEVRAAKLHRSHFELCLGPVKDVLARSRAEDPKYSYYRRASRRVLDEGPPAGTSLDPGQVE